MAEPGTTGIGADAAQTGMKAITDLLKELSDSSNIKRSEQAVKALQGEIRKLAQTSKLSTSDNSILIETFKKLRAAEVGTSEATKALTDKLAESAEMMSSTTRAEIQDRIEQYKVMASTLKGNDKESSLQRALLAKEGKASELSLFRDNLTKQIELGKAMVGKNQTFASNAQGFWKSVSGQMQLAGRGAAEMAGGLMGVSAGTMGAIAGMVGFVAAIYMVIKALIEAGSKGAMNAAKIGIDISDSYSQAYATGVNYNWMIKQTGAAWVFGSEKLQELVEIANKDYVTSITAVGDAYIASLSGSAQARNAIRAGSIEFVSDMALVSARFGLTADDSVKMATKMGVVSRSTKEITEKAFVRLNIEALKLGISMESLMGPFSEIAAQASYTGRQADYSVGELMAFGDVIKQLAAPGRGIHGFMNMTNAGMSELTTKVVSFAAKIDEFRVAAITSRPGESFGSMLSRVADMSPAAKMASVKQLAAQTGVSLDPKSSAQNAFALAKMMGFSGTLKDTLSMGRYMQQAASGGTLSDAGIQARMAKQIDDRLASAKTVGGAVAAGADVNQFIANLVKNMLDVVIGIANTLGSSWLIHGSEAGQAASLVQSSMAAKPEPSSYGAQPLGHGRKAGWR